MKKDSRVFLKKIIYPCLCDVGGINPAHARAFCKITFEGGKLSIHGVVGPLRGGNCQGSCGQCVDAIRSGTPAEGWTSEMLQKFCDIWEAWHLNDMRPYCQHQKKLGWDKLAVKEVTLYNYSLKAVAQGCKEKAEKAALEALRKGETFTPTEEQVYYATLPFSITLPHEATPEILQDYKPAKPLFSGDDNATTKKTLGWLTPDEHPDGILGKPCPMCGYRYGAAWKKETVPQEVIDWLASLPDSPVDPAWV